MKGRGLCVSLLFDPSTYMHSVNFTKEEILKRVEKPKQKLCVTEEDIRHIEVDTKHDDTQGSGMRYVAAD